MNAFLIYYVLLKDEKIFKEKNVNFIVPSFFYENY